MQRDFVIDAWVFNAGFELSCLPMVIFPDWILYKAVLVCQNLCGANTEGRCTAANTLGCAKTIHLWLYAIISKCYTWYQLVHRLYGHHTLSGLPFFQHGLFNLEENINWHWIIGHHLHPNQMHCEAHQCHLTHWWCTGVKTDGYSYDFTVIVCLERHLKPLIVCFFD